MTHIRIIVEQLGEEAGVAILNEMFQPELKRLLRFLREHMTQNVTDFGYLRLANRDDICSEVSSKNMPLLTTVALELARINSTTISNYNAPEITNEQKLICDQTVSIIRANLANRVKVSQVQHGIYSPFASEGAQMKAGGTNEIIKLLT